MEAPLPDSTPLSRDAIAADPKVDLHLHLDGALTAHIIHRVADRHALPVPGIDEQTLEALRRVYPDPGPFDASKPEEFDRFLALFGRAFSVMRQPQPLQDTTREVVGDLARQNLIYAELRFAPSYHIGDGFDMDEVVDSVLRGMKQGESDTGMPTKLILCIPREIAHTPGYRGPSAMNIVDTAINFRNEGVVGIDLACNEHFGPEPYIPAFVRAGRAGLKRTAHAGEAGPQRARNIVKAFHSMTVDGLGHALPLWKMKDTMKQVKAAGVRVERLPVSNKCMGLQGADLDGIGILLDSGVLVTVGSDDPGIFGPTCTLTENLLAVGTHLGMNLGGVRGITQNGITGAFVDEAQRARIQAEFERRIGKR